MKFLIPKTIKELSLREFYNYLTNTIKMCQTCLDIDDEHLQDTIKNDPSKCLRDDITVEKYLECYGDDSAGLWSVEN
jgi:hypothetical protein